MSFKTGRRRRTTRTERKKRECDGPKNEIRRREKKKGEEGRFLRANDFTELYYRSLSGTHLQSLGQRVKCETDPEIR